MGMLSDAFVIYDHLLGKLVPPALFLGTAYGAYAGGAAVGTVLAQSIKSHGHHQINLLDILLGNNH